MDVDGQCGRFLVLPRNAPVVGFRRCGRCRCSRSILRGHQDRCFPQTSCAGTADQLVARRDGHSSCSRNMQHYRSAKACTLRKAQGSCSHRSREGAFVMGCGCAELGCNITAGFSAQTWPLKMRRHQRPGSHSGHSQAPGSRDSRVWRCRSPAGRYLLDHPTQHPWREPDHSVKHRTKHTAACAHSAHSARHASTQTAGLLTDRPADINICQLDCRSLDNKHTLSTPAVWAVGGSVRRLERHHYVNALRL